MAKANVQDRLGALLNRGLTDSSTSRVEHALSENGVGGLGGILESLGLAPAQQPVAAGARSGAGTNSDMPTGGSPDLFGKLGSIVKSFLGDEKNSKSLAAGGLGALVGALFGGGKGSAKGALGGGALALLGSIALQALRGSNGASEPVGSEAKLAAGLRAPESEDEVDQVSDIVDLTVKAMINAAKADGRIDEDEMQKVVGELQEGGITSAERDYLMAEVRKPLCTEEIVRAVPNQQVAAQVYAASLLAIEVDTPTEQAYLDELARELNLDPQVTSRIQSTLGMT